MTTEPKKYACRNCGYPYEIYPPDDIHTTAKLSPCEFGDSILMKYECGNCNHPNEIHWDGYHPKIVQSRR